MCSIIVPTRFQCECVSFVNDTFFIGRPVLRSTALWQPNIVITHTMCIVCASWAAISFIFLRLGRNWKCRKFFRFSEHTHAQHLEVECVAFSRYSISEFARSSTNQSTTVKRNNETNIFILFTRCTSQEALCNYLRIAIEECFAPFFERLNKRKIVYKMCGWQRHICTNCLENRVIKNAFAIQWTIRHVNARNFIVFVIGNGVQIPRERIIYLCELAVAERMRMNLSQHNV